MTIVRKTEDSLMNMRNKYMKGTNGTTVNMTNTMHNMRLNSEDTHGAEVGYVREAGSDALGNSRSYDIGVTQRSECEVYDDQG